MSTSKVLFDSIRYEIWALSAAVLLSVATTANAGTDTWNQSTAGGSWSAGPWTGNSPPMNGDSLVFGPIGSGTLLNDITGLSIDGITFNTGAPTFLLTGNTITFLSPLDAGGGTISGGNITENSAANQTIGLPVTIAPGNYTIGTAAGAGQLNLSGTITRSAGATVQFSKSGGNINLTNSGLANDASGILGGWATIGLGNNASDWASMDSSGNVVAYTGYTNFAGGTSISGTSNITNVKINTRSSTASTLNGGAAGTYDMNTLEWNIGNSNPSGNQTVNIAAGQILRLGANGAIMNDHSGSRTFNVGNGVAGSAITAGGADNTNGELTLYSVPFSNGNQRLQINAPINDNGTGVVTVNSLGDVELKQPGTFSGGLNIVSGRMQANILGALGTGTIQVLPGAEVFPWDSGAADTYTNNWILAGSGSASQDAFALRVGVSGTETFTGTINLPSTAVLGIATSVAGGGMLTTGVISGPGGLTATGGYNTGTLTLGETTPNTYQGDTTVDSSLNGNTIAITFLSGSNNIMPSGSGTGNVVIVGSAHTSTFDLNGTTQNINGLIATSGTLSNAIVQSSSSGGLLVLGNNNATATFGGIIQDGAGTMALTKVGTGRQTLGGTNTYSGDTNINNGVLSITGSLGGSGAVNINGGTLAGTGSINGPVTLNGGVIDAGAIGPGSTGTLTLNNGLTVNGGHLNFDLGSTSDLLAVSGAVVNFAAASALAPTGGAPNSTYTVITGLMTGSAIPTLIQPATARVSYSYDSSSYNGSNGANSVVIDVSGQTGNLTWNNAGLTGDGQTWDVVGNKNWFSNATIGDPNKFFQGDNVTFNDSNNNHYNVTIAGIVNPGSITVSTNGNYTLGGSGAIGGTASLTMSGNGSLTLATSNSFSGGTTLNNGTLNANSANALGTGPVFLNSGILNINNASALGVGALNINGGVLDNMSAAALTVTTNNPQVWSEDFTFNGTHSLNLGSGPVTLNSSPTITVTNNTLTIGGVIANGTGNGITKTGNGTLVLSANNNFNGGLTIDAGTVIVNGSGGGSALGSGNTNVNAGTTLVGANGDSFGYNLGTASPATIFINGGTVTDAGTASYRITLPDIHFTNGGILTSASGNAGDANGNYSLFAGTVESDPATSTAVISAGAISLQNGVTTFTVAPGTVSGGSTPAVDLLVSSVLRNFNSTAGSVVKNGDGVMLLTGINTYTGTTSINAGVLKLGAANVIAPASNLVLGGGTLAASGFSQTMGTVTLNSNSTIDLGAGTNTLTFADSSGVAWGGVLSISRWNFSTNPSLGNHLIFNGSGLNPTQLGAIQFADFSQGASIAANATSIFAVGEVTPLIGDINQDGHVDASDIFALEKALTDVGASGTQDTNSYAFQHPSFTNSDIQFILDVNGDGTINNADIQSLINYLLAGNGSTTTVPEPCSFALLAVGGLFCLRRKHGRTANTTE